MQALESPCGWAGLVNEFGREPIQQLRVRRWFALYAEVFAGADDAGAEVLLPDAVHRDARCERVFGRDEPAGEVEARGRRSYTVLRSSVERILSGGGLGRAQRRGDAGIHAVAVREEVAADVDEGLARL